MKIYTRKLNSLSVDLWQIGLFENLDANPTYEILL